MITILAEYVVFYAISVIRVSECFEMILPYYLGQ